MSDAAPAAADAPKGKGKTKLLILIAVGLLVLAGAGVAAFLMLRKPAAELDEHGEPVETHASAQAAAKPAHREPGKPPTFLPLEPFVVNLADKEQERYAQVGITLQVDEAKVAEELKAYMPAIRNGVIMILAHKTAAELLSRDGKEKLAAEIRRESVRPLGIEVEDEDEEPPAGKKRRRRAPVHVPVEQVHFSSFIIQ